MKVNVLIYREDDEKSFAGRSIDGKKLYEYSVMHAEGLECVKRIVLCCPEAESDSIASMEDEDILMILDNACPIRNAEDLIGACEMLENHPDADAVVSIAEKGSSDNLWTMRDGVIKPVCRCEDKEPVYTVSPNFSIFRVGAFKKGNINNTLGYEIKKDYCISSENDFVKVSRILDICYCTGKQFVFDIDGVIAQLNPKLNYADTEPVKQMVRIVNDIYNRGNSVILFTARGYVTGIDWREVTEKEMKDWGVQYTELKFGKPNAEYYIDDKFLDLSELNLISEIKNLIG